MSAYRRVEPAFCRGCGRPWVAGADVCAACGESIVAAATATDPQAPRKLRAALIAVSLVLGVRWIVLFLLVDEPASAAETWLTVAAATMALVVLSARAWYPGRWWAGGEGPRRIVGSALGLGLGLACGLAFAFGELGIGGFGGELAITLAGDVPAWIAVAVVVALLDELLLRGILFDGVAAIGGTANAVIAGALVSGLAAFDPFAAVVGGVAGLLRGWSGSLAPSLAFRLAWVAALIGASTL